MQKTKRKKEAPLDALQFPGGIKTSAMIIEEARQSVRLVPTSRPFTPAGGRNLYGTARNNTYSRPTSNISLGHPSAYIDEHPIPPIHGQTLEPLDNDSIPGLSVPPTPVQSVVDIAQLPTTTIQNRREEDHAHSSPTTTSQIPVLKKSSQSPVISKRVLSSEGSRSHRQVPNVETGTDKKRRGGTNEPKPTGGSTKRAAIKLWDDKVEPLLKILDGFTEGSPSHGKLDEIYDSCDRLWKVLCEGGFHGSTAGLAGKSRRSALLRCLFQLLRLKYPVVLVKILVIILSMKVVGGNLLKVCQHLFSITREENNDRYLITENIVGPLVDVLSVTDPFSNIDATIYGLGAIKLMSSNNTLRGSLNSVGVVKLIADYLMKCCMDKSLPMSIIVQLIGVLRNLSDSSDMYQEFLSHDILPLVSEVVSRNTDNAEIVYYTSRFFSKLTLHSECIQSLSRCERYLSIVPELIIAHNHNEDIVVRLCFILGNLTSTNPSLAQQLYHTHRLRPSIDNTLRHYFETVKSIDNDPQHVADTPTKSRDILVKVIRLLANICVHQSIAVEFSREADTLHLLLNIIGYCMVSDAANEEVVINALVVFNNLSYYADIGSELRQTLTEVIISLLVITNDMIMLECVRVLGNISKHKEVRTLMTSKRVDELLVTLLDSSKLELVFSSCGVLINLTADPLHKDILRKHYGIKKLIDVLSHFGRQDWQLSSLVCKILWNYCDGNSLDDNETSNITHLLEEFLDPVTAFTAYLMDEDDDNDESVSESSIHGDKSQIHATWETEFAPVAKMLLNKLTVSYNQ